MSLRFTGAVPVALRFPRVSGDEPGMLAVLMSPSLFSPRERG